MKRERGGAQSGASVNEIYLLRCYIIHTLGCKSDDAQRCWTDVGEWHTQQSEGYTGYLQFKQIYHLWCLHVPHFVPLGSCHCLNFNYECYKVVCKAFMLIRLGSIWPVQKVFEVKVIVAEVEWWIDDDTSVWDESHFCWWDGNEKVVIRSDKEGKLPRGLPSRLNGTLWTRVTINWALTLYTYLNCT